MADTDAQNWDNYWQGRASNATGNALIEVGIEDNHDLNRFWLDFLNDKSKSTGIIDFACGAGSVLKHAHSLGLQNLTGVDISQSALRVLSRNISTASAICAPVDKTGLKDEFYDLAVSQFGIEYAGNRKKLQQAFQEMHRILKPGGDIAVISHIKDGIIYEGCRNSLTQIELIEKSQFITTVRQVILTLHKNQDQTQKAELQKLMDNLNTSAKPLSDWLRSVDRTKNEFARFTYHLLEASHKLITNHKGYTKADSLNWLKGMQSELAAYKGRMASMTQAALSAGELSSLIGKLTSNIAELTFQPHQTLHFNTNEKPAAWIIKASKAK